jgi:nucleoid-associated protein YgaU
MGLFDFVGNIGKKLFGAKETKEDAAAKIKAEIDVANLGIQGLQEVIKNADLIFPGQKIRIPPAAA